jgi:hypothetical protein
MACDLCGQMIRPGERYRAVRDEYSPVEYHEHIQCPRRSGGRDQRAASEAAESQNAFNHHALCLA